MEKSSSNVVYQDLPGFGRRLTLACHALVAISWSLSLAASVYYTVIEPSGTQMRPIWTQSYLHPTAFTMDSIVGSLYWINLFARQLLCIGIALLSPKPRFSDAIVSTSGYFIAFNLLHLGSVILLAYSYFAWAQVILVLNFVNVSALYFRHHHHPSLLHSAMISGPLSWTYFSMYWNGFCIAPQSEGARVVASVFLWGMLGYGLFFAFAYKDATICLFLSFLATSVAVYHMTAHSHAQLWAPPIVIATSLFTAAVAINVSRWTKSKTCGNVMEADDERGVEHGKSFGGSTMR